MEYLCVPPWLQKLVSTTTFFWECDVHEERNKNECNKFCLDCASDPLCFRCVQSRHRGHRVIQIRKSSYHDVVRVTDIQGHLDIRGIQTYAVTETRVVFLNERITHRRSTKKVRQSVKFESECKTCTKDLIELSDFCSLGCKLVWTKRNQKKRESAEKIEKERLRKMRDAVTRRLSSEEEDKDKEEEDKEQHEEIPIESCQCTDSRHVSPGCSFSRRTKKRKATPHRAPFF